MVTESDNNVLDFLRRIDEKVDRAVEDVRDVKVRMTAAPEGPGDIEIAIAGVNRRIDTTALRLNRIERRLDLVELPH